MNGADGTTVHDDGHESPVSRAQDELFRLVARLRDEVREYLRRFRSSLSRHRTSLGDRSPTAEPRAAHRKVAAGLLDQIRTTLADLDEDDAPLHMFRALLDIDQDRDAINEAWLTADAWLHGIQSRLMRDARGPLSVRPVRHATESGRRRPAASKAYGQYKWAIEQDPLLADRTDNDVYDWLRRKEEYRDEMPSCDTWKRHLREARRVEGTQKHTSRRGRDGRNVVRGDSL